MSSRLVVPRPQVAWQQSSAFLIAIGPCSSHGSEAEIDLKDALPLGVLLWQVLMRALGFNVKKQEVVKLVHEVDPHNNGTVDYDNFLEISR